MNNLLKNIFPTAGRLGKDLITDTPVLFATGDLVLAFHKAELTGILTNIAVTSATIASRLYQSTTKNGEGLGYIPLTLNQAWTGGSILMEGVRQHGLQELFTSGTAETLKTLQTAFIFAMSVPALALECWQKTKHTKPSGSFMNRIVQDPLAYLGVANAVVTADNHWPPLFFAAGLLRRFNKPGEETPQPGESKFYRLSRKEIDTDRLFRTGFLTAAALSSHDPFYMVAFVCWGMAYQYINKDKDKKPVQQQNPVSITTKNFMAVARNVF